MARRKIREDSQCKNAPLGRSVLRIPLSHELINVNTMPNYLSIRLLMFYYRYLKFKNRNEIYKKSNENTLGLFFIFQN